MTLLQYLLALVCAVEALLVLAYVVIRIRLWLFNKFLDWDQAYDDARRKRK